MIRIISESFPNSKEPEFDFKKLRQQLIKNLHTGIDTKGIFAIYKKTGGDTQNPLSGNLEVLL